MGQSIPGAAPCGGEPSLLEPQALLPDLEPKAPWLVAEVVLPSGVGWRNHTPARRL